MPGPRHVAVPRLLHVGPEAIGALTELIDDGFDVRDVVVVSGATSSAEHARRVASDLMAGGSAVRHVVDPAGTTSSVTDLVESLDQQPATLVLAIGGGRPVDVAKLAAHRAHADLVVVPTVLSHDGLCSPVASLVAGDGHRRSLPAVTPTGVVVDTAIIGRAPAHYLQAGVGDLVSNLTAVTDWRISAERTGERVDELAASMALTAARSVLDIDWPPGDADLETIARGLLLSGIAMEIATTSRPCSGSEHLISHALDAHQPSDGRLHGEQVALGTCIAVTAQEHPVADRVTELFDRIGLTERLGSWLDDIDLAAAIAAAPATRPARYTVLSELDRRGWDAARLAATVRRS